MGGGVWSARSADPVVRFEVGANVVVEEVRGVSAIVAADAGPEPEPGTSSVAGPAPED